MFSFQVRSKSNGGCGPQRLKAAIRGVAVWGAAEAAPFQNERSAFSRRQRCVRGEGRSAAGQFVRWRETELRRTLESIRSKFMRPS